MYPYPVYKYHICTDTRWGLSCFVPKHRAVSELERGTWTYCHVPYNEKVYVKVDKTKNSFDSAPCLKASHCLLSQFSLSGAQLPSPLSRLSLYGS